MKEQAVLGSFRDPDSARKCEEEIRALGVEEVQIDRVDAYPGDSSNHLTNFRTGNLPSLAGATLGTTFSGRDASILLSAHPDASGMAGNTGGLDDITGFDILLTAVCDSSLVERVVNSIKQNGGRT